MPDDDRPMECDMRQTLQQFEQWLRASGVHCSRIHDTATDDVGVFIDDEDVTSLRKKQKIAATAKRMGVKVLIADKGAIFL